MNVKAIPRVWDALPGDETSRCVACKVGRDIETMPGVTLADAASAAIIMTACQAVIEPREIPLMLSESCPRHMQGMTSVALNLCDILGIPHAEMMARLGATRAAKVPS